MAEAALTGLRVLDLTHGIAGPYCTKLFADCGAEVVKVERPGSGDFARRLGPFPKDDPHPEKSGLFLHLNTSKQSITLNLKTATGRQILEGLVRDADLLVESFRPGVMARLGMGYEVLQQLNPRLVVVSISNFGQTGPYRDYQIDDMLGYALGGVLYVTGAPEREPIKIGLYAPLFLVGSVAAAMGFGAYWGARRTGKGEYVDVAIMEVLAGSMDRGAPNLMAAAYNGELMVQRSRDRRTSILPGGVYPCEDGYVQVVIQPNWWDRFCRTLGRPDLITDTHFTQNFYNLELAPEIDEIFYPWVLSHTKQEIMEKAQAEGLPISAINTMEDVFNDPQLRFRGYFVTLDHPIAGSYEYPGPQFKLQESPIQLRRAPLLGEHNQEVFCGRLGFSKQDLVVLRERGVI